MEPRIQYAKTADGVSIAFWTLGEGPPLVHMPFVFGNIQLEWRLPGLRLWLEGLMHGRKLVRYDRRGSGLSERHVTVHSLDTLMQELDAVADRLNLDSFALLAGLHLVPAAIAYAALHPERVSHLILWCGWARASDYYRSPQVQSLASLRDKDWDVYLETMSHAFFGWSVGDQAHQWAVAMGQSVTQEETQAFVGAASQFDVADLLPKVTSPTLVLHPRQFRLVDVGLAMGLASQIQNARLTVLEGESSVPWLDDTEAVLKAIDEFLGESEEATAGAAPSGLVTVLFTDMEGSTTLTQRLGDARAQEVLRTHNAIIRDALKAHGGSEIKHTGDGVMASFTSASRALECAIAIQRALAQHNESNPDTSIRVRIGLNAGEPVAEEKDLFGTAVQLAARICAHAQPGEIVAANVVRELAAGKGFLLADRGDVALRGFEDPVRLYEVRWRD